MTEFVTIGGKQRPFRWSFKAQNHFNEWVHNAALKGEFIGDAVVIFIGLYYGELFETKVKPTLTLEKVEDWIDNEPQCLKQLNETFEKLLKKYGEAVGMTTEELQQMAAKNQKQAGKTAQK